MLSPDVVRIIAEMVKEANVDASTKFRVNVLSSIYMIDVWIDRPRSFKKIISKVMRSSMERLSTLPYVTFVSSISKVDNFDFFVFLTKRNVPATSFILGEIRNSFLSPSHEFSIEASEVVDVKSIWSKPNMKASSFDVKIVLNPTYAASLLLKSVPKSIMDRELLEAARTPVDLARELDEEDL